DGGENWPAEQTFPVRWRSHDTAGLVNIDLMQMGNPTPVLSIAAGEANDGEFEWPIEWPISGTVTPGTNFLIRVTRTDLAIDDSSNGTFTITDPISIYYVNDDVVHADGNDWTTAAGDDIFNDGLTPATPKASIRAVLEAYDLGLGDIIRVDNGTYTLTANIIITNNDAGVTIEGYQLPADPARRALIDRANVSSGSYVFDLQDADDITLDHLAITGSHYGIHAGSGSDSDNVTISNCDVFATQVVGIRMLTGNDFPVIEDNVVHDIVQTFTTGIELHGEGAAVRGTTGNEVYGARTGVSVEGAGSSVSGNAIHDNYTGIEVSNRVDLTNPTIVDLNTVYDNISTGIDISGRAIASENTVQGLPGSGGIGIVGSSDASIVENVVYDNDIGISTGNGAYALGNEVYNSANIGIQAMGTGPILENTIYGNLVGVELLYSFTARVANNLLHCNADYGVLVSGSNGPEIVNNTIHQPTGDAIRLKSGAKNVDLRNNILWVEDGYAISVDTNSQVGFSSDYNLFVDPEEPIIYSPGVRIAGPGVLGYWEERDFTNLTDWFYEIGLGEHSLMTDPLFVNSAAGDYHVLSTSPAIDSGDPASYHLREPQPNGGRVNLGAYGNTPEAQTSPPQIVQVLAPNGLEKFELGQQTSIQWRSWGLTPTQAVALINAGGETVDNWLYDNYYLGGNIGSSASAMDTSGVSDPVPPEAVYQSYRYGASGVDETLQYHMPVPDGTYTLRLHFVEHSYGSAGYRVFDIVIQGVTEVTDFDIRQTNDRRVATTLSFPVDAASDEGILLTLLNKTSQPAIISAIELTADNPGGVAAPTVDLELSTDTGNSWGAIASGLSMDWFGRGDLAWNAAPETIGDAALVRATANDGTGPRDVSDELFMIAGDGPDYYINDDIIIDADDWTSVHGSNGNTGKSPDQPMASLAALLSAYDLDSGDTIYVDNGAYSLVRNVVIAEQDSAVRIEGYHLGAQPARRAILDRGNTSTGSYAVELINADDVTLDHLVIIGAHTGVYATYTSDSDDLVISNCDLYDHYYYGVRLDTSNDNAIFLDNTLHGLPSGSSIGIYSRGDGAYVGAGDDMGGDVGGVVGNEVDGFGTGIHVSGEGSTVRNATAYNNNIGIHLENGTGSLQWSAALDNVARDNTQKGIEISGNVMASGNTVHGQNGSGDTGIVASSGATVMDNTVYDNYTGISLSYNVSAGGNEVYNNTDAGIYANYAVDIFENILHGNSIGVHLGSSYSGRARNNLLYSNTNTGFYVTGIWPNTIHNNTVHQVVGDAVRLEAAAKGTSLRSNILSVYDGYAINVSPNSQVDFDSDYNLFHITPPGKLATWQGHDFTDLADWFYELGRDQHSLAADPLFVNPAAGNYHVQNTSPAIDLGDPASYYLREPQPNGGRANQGAYGNTPEAQTSPSQIVQVLAPNGLERFDLGQATNIQWRSWGLTPTQTVGLINAGGETIDNWLYDNYYVSGYGSLFTSAVDTTGVADPAPEAVYQTYRYRAYGVGETFQYHLPVPDGTYTVRLHFAEPSYTTEGSRVFDIVLQGVTVAPDFDIIARAVTPHTATAPDYPATASASEGILLTLVNKTNNYAIISAIEITADNPGGVAAPTVNLELSTNTGGGPWAPLGADLPMDSFGRGGLPWNAAPETAGHTALIRVTANHGTNPQDDSDRPFMIGNAGTDYYVNDDSTTDDEFTNAVGNNANSGKHRNFPMRTLRALIAAYDLDPGDTVHVDTGSYELLENIVIGAQDSGVRIQGPTHAVAVLDRANTARDRFVFELQDADDLTIDSLHITGGEEGLHAAYDSDSDRLTLSHCDVFANRDYGIRIEHANDDALITANSVYDMINGYGVGVYLYGHRITMAENDVYNNKMGIDVSNSGPDDDGTIISGNTVHDNTGTGIYASGTVLLTGNTVYGQAGANDEGIYVRTGVRATQNVVHSNYDGIIAYDSSVTDNRVFNNTNIGIDANYGTSVLRNKIYSNSIGVRAGSNFDGQITNNLIYTNTNQGVLVRGYSSRDFEIVNNTIYQPVGDAIRLQDNVNNSKIRNNILWVEAGYDIYVATNSQVECDSNYNLFWAGSDPNAHVGYWGGSVQDLLADWQAASGLDLNGLHANPELMDINGADNVLAYSIAGGGYDGGADDNFHLTAMSPAIDRADAWAAPPTDIDGFPRTDDPGSPNLGSPDYAEIDLGPNPFPTAGTAKNWRSDNGDWSLTPLPFTFPFYDDEYTSVEVSSNGLLHFEGPDPVWPADNTTPVMIVNHRIAPLWDDLATNTSGKDIYVDESVADQVTIRWGATNLADSSDANVSVTLFSTGEIRFDYGPGNTPLTPTVGISRGDGNFYVLSMHDGQADLGDANSVRFALTSGITFTDIGAYEFRGSSDDVDAPLILATAPAAIHAAAAAHTPLNTIAITFGEVVNTIDANAPANYELRSDGADNIFGNTDDDIYVLTPHHVTGTASVTLDIPGPLPVDRYRLTVSGDDSIHDLAGLRLDGDANGTEGGDYLRIFDLSDILLTVESEGADGPVHITGDFPGTTPYSATTASMLLVHLSAPDPWISDTTQYYRFLRWILVIDAVESPQADGVSDLDVLMAGNRTARAVYTPTWPITGDVNGDCVVNILDMLFVRNTFLRDIATADNWRADVNSDGTIDVIDMLIVRDSIKDECE
ncbi:MAG: right-handed parallel beta-helix repeat-containing protein, partial [Planctomycetes bacterium]|nr:right-handed parallel beta-helix repeat-containing protein [Planctomycetota bacterium]